MADISNLVNELKTNAAQHLDKLKCEFKSYFTELRRDHLSLARNRFQIFSDDVEGKLQDRFIDMKNNSSCQDVFDAFPVTDFWLRLALSHPKISKTALKKFLPFSFAWLYKSVLSTLFNVKTKQRNR